ncbi:HEAT repeat domain-containing protein [Gemmatimonadota bacterium]
MDSMDSFDFKPLEQDKQEEIVERLRSQIEGEDLEAVKRAVIGLGWLEGGDEFVEPLLKLATGGSPELAAAALEGLGRIGSPASEQPLARLVLELFHRDEARYAEVRAEAIRVLGKVGGKGSTRFLAELIRKQAPASPLDREAAVEALVSLADNGVAGMPELIEELLAQAAGELKTALQAASRELNRQEWEDKGFLTIEADLKRSEED